MMTKTQVQIPDELLQKAKKVAAQKGWSFAEIVRRGLEHMTTVKQPGRYRRVKGWLSKPTAMGTPFAQEDEWAGLSHNEKGQ